MTEYAQRNLKLLNILSFLATFRGFEGVIVVFYVTVSGSFTLGMGLWALVFISASIFEVPTGVFSDRIGRKWTLVVHYLAYFLSILCLYFAEGPLLLAASSVLVGFGMALRSGTTSAFVYENLEVLERLDDFRRDEGFRQALGRYALVASGIVGTLAIFLFDVRVAIALSLPPLALAVALSVWLREVRGVHHRTSNVYADIGAAWRRFMDDTSLRELSIGRILSVGAGNAEYRFRSLFYAVLVPEWIVNLLGILNNFISGISMQLVHRAVRRWGIVRALVHTELFDRSSTTVLALIGTPISVFGMATVSSAVFGIRQIASEDVLQQRYSKDERATMGSLVGVGGNVVYAVVAFGSGLLADSIGVVYTLLVFQVLLLLVPLFFYLGTRTRSQNTVH